MSEAVDFENEDITARRKYMENKKNGFINFFASEWLMLASMIVAVVASVAQSIMNAKIISLFSAFTFLVNAVCMLVLFISYKKHDKNVMKGMMGAVFMLMLLRSADTLCRNLSVEEPSILMLIVSVVPFVLIAVLTVNHFIINADRHSKPWNIKVNQIAYMALFVVVVVIRMIMVVVSDSLFLRMSYLVSIFTIVSSLCLLVCIETRLEGYKEVREANGWVETPYSSN